MDKENFTFYQFPVEDEITIRFLDVRYFVHKIEPMDTQHKPGTLPGCPLCDAGYPVVMK